MRIAYDPTPLHGHYDLLDFPRVVRRLGYQWMQLTPHPDFIPFFRHPRADNELIDLLSDECSRQGVGISSLLPVQRWSGPEENLREGAIRNWKRIIEIALRLNVQTINTEFSGRPEAGEQSEICFYRSLEELMPRLERECIRLNIDPHPGDFVEKGDEALRIIRGLNSPNIGLVYVAAHTFHMGDIASELIKAAGPKLGAVYLADTFDHRRSAGLRYITNPPGSPARVHQHTNIGDGDVNWQELFSALSEIGYLRRREGLIVSNVFAENESWESSATTQLQRIRELVESAR